MSTMSSLNAMIEQARHQKMRTTTDTFTGKPFRWNAVVTLVGHDGDRTVVPARFTRSTQIHLDSSRVTARLLAELNA